MEMPIMMSLTIGELDTLKNSMKAEINMLGISNTPDFMFSLLGRIVTELEIYNEKR